MAVDEDHRPTTDRPDPDPRSHRDTEPLAIWGFVLTFVLWPAGLVVSYLALRRVRRTRDGGWGLAVAGLALSGLLGATSVVALLYFLATSGTSSQWAHERAQRANERLVESVTRDVVDDVAAWRDTEGEWPAGLSVLGTDVADDGTVREVTVTVHTDGTEVCAEGTRDGFSGAYADGAFHPRTPCADLGMSATLASVRHAERQAEQQSALEAARAAVRERGETAAAGATLGEPRDLGLRAVPQVDLLACALVAGNKGHLDAPIRREALALELDERAERVDRWGLDNEAYELARPELHDPQDAVDDAQYGEALLRAELACWHGGFVGPDGDPTFPDAWTAPLTQEDLDADEARRSALAQMTEEERLAAATEETAVYEAERAQLAEILESYP